MDSNRFQAFHYAKLRVPERTNMNDSIHRVSEVWERTKATRVHENY